MNIVPEILLPEPQNTFDVSPDVINELADEVERALSIHINNMSSRRQRLVFSLARGLVDSCSEAMHETTTQIHLVHGLVMPGKAHLVPLWHTDEIGGEKRVVVADCLAAEFAFGKCPLNSTLGRAFHARWDGIQGEEDFDSAVEEALSTEKLSFHKGSPYAAVPFTKKQVHRSATNTSSEPVDRFYFKAVA